MGARRVALSPVIVSRDSHSAGSPEKGRPGSTCRICRVCGSGIWVNLSWGMGAPKSVELEEYKWARPGTCHACIDRVAADHRASIQFLFSFRQSVDNTDWTGDVPPSNSVNCLGLSPSLPPRRFSQ